MKKRLYKALILSCILAVTSLGTAFAQMSQGEGRRPAFKSDTEMTNDEYSGMKKRALLMIEERRKRLEEEKACVEAATNISELRKCRPQPPRGQGGAFQGGTDQRPQQGMPGDMRQP